MDLLIYPDLPCRELVLRVLVAELLICGTLILVVLLYGALKPFCDVSVSSREKNLRGLLCNHSVIVSVIYLSCLV